MAEESGRSGDHLDARVADAVAEARERIAAVADGRPVALVAVTKGFGPAEVAAAVRAGADACGENYAQELVGKAEALASAGDPGRVVPTWHFIGQLQTNKVRMLAPHVSLWQSVDRPSLATEIARRAPGADVLVQCDLSGEPQKGGCPLEEVPGLVEHARSLGLDVRGLMGVPAAGPSEVVGEAFSRLVRLADALELPERSIGMSGDFEEAVRRGATMVRLGSVLFGSRPPRIAG